LHDHPEALFDLGWSTFYNMIHLSIRTFSKEDLDSLHKNVVFYLGKQELSEYEHYRVLKRKDEYIASRVAMKDLVITHCSEAKTLRRNEIQVFKESSGVPYLMIEGIRRLPGWISLSHSNGSHFSAFSPDDVRFGVDIEHIEPRPEEFVKDYFTDKEQNFFDTLDSINGALFTTLAWSVKESVLKACGIGLGIDTRSLEIKFPLPAKTVNRWGLVEISSSELKIPHSRIFWSRDGEFILTVCVLESSSQELTCDQAVLNLLWARKPAIPGLNRCLEPPACEPGIDMPPR